MTGGLGCSARTARDCAAETVTPLVVAGANIAGSPARAAAAAMAKASGTFDDDDVRAGVQAVMGGPVQGGRLVERRCPGGVAVLGRSGVAGGVAADEPVDAPAVGKDGDDEAAAVGVDQLPGPGPLGQVELQQLGGGDSVIL